MLRRVASTIVLAAAVVLVAPAPARAAAWPVSHGWSDLVDPTDPDSRTYAEAYPEFVRDAAPGYLGGAVRLDCADFSITLLCEYAAQYGLPLTFRYWGAGGAVLEARSTSAAFASKDAYVRFVRNNVNAMMLAKLNTRAIGYDEWASGDHVLMNWNQSDVEPNYPGRTVWHTYVIGVPDEVIYYGSMNDGEPTEIYETRTPEHLERVRSHPDRYLAAPRRFLILTYRQGFEVPPAAIAPAPGAGFERRYAAFEDVPVRLGPGTARASSTRLVRGAAVTVTGRYRGFAEMAAPPGWVSEALLGVAAPAGPETFGRVVATSANVRLGPSVAYVAVERLRAGDPVKVLGRQGDWLRVATPATMSTPDLDRYIFASLVTVDGSGTPPPPALGMGTVTASSLNVRSGPGTGHAVVTRLASGARVAIHEDRSGWYRVTWPGAPAGGASGLWCSAAHVRRE